MSYPTIYIRDKAFINLLRRNKKYELRLYRGIIKKFKPGDIVYLMNGSRNTFCMMVIKTMHLYENFTELMSELGSINCLPNHTFKDGLKHMNNIYSPELQNKHSVVAIEFKFE
jgi:ASC-1-like (ASCH) protein